MTLTFNPAVDFADVTDGLAAVTLTRRGTSTTVAVASALQRAVSKREAAASNGQVTASDVRYHLPTEECATSPRLGDTITDAGGTVWTIIEVTRATLATRWACLCRDLALVYGLDDTIVIEQATYAKGAGGALEPTWATWKVVRARIQPAAAEIDTTQDARVAVKRYQILVAEDVTGLDQSHRIKDRKGTVYQVNGYSGAERIGDVQTIDVEVSPWPLP